MEPELRSQEHENRHLYRPADRQALRQAGIPRRGSQGADSERACPPRLQHPHRLHAGNDKNVLKPH